MSGAGDLAARTLELKRAFDRAFALPPKPQRPPAAEVLVLTVGPARYAARLDGIAGVYTRRKVVPVPGGAPHLLGVAGVRGALVPVFDLASLLGHAGSKDAPRWLVLSRGEPAIGFGFDGLEAYLKLEQLDGDVAQTPHGTLPLIDVSRLLRETQQREGNR